MFISRWSLIERTLLEALAQPPADRAAFIDRACAGDDDLRCEVESLLDYEQEERDFLERPALEVTARASGTRQDTSLVGREIGVYRLHAFIGAGGMGDVYRACDLTLGRDVALKVLERPHWSAVDFDRFEEEARTASILNHPNIVTIFGVGGDGEIAYIAMELVHGQTLRDVLVAGGLPVERALDLAARFADALAAAHAAGIVHRDLKPDNVMVTPQGRVKVLDFGIARRCTDAVRPQPETGAILGTAAYMSPEQAQGEPASTASDRFSFGVILYELLTGRRPFERASKVATLDAIVNDDATPIDPEDMSISPALRSVVARCLSKRADERYANTEELTLALRTAREQLHVPAGLSRRRALWLVAAAALSTTIGVGAWRAAGRAEPVRSVAILPFANTRRDEDTTPLCEGLTATLIRRLGQVPSLTVMSRSLVFNFRDKRVDPRTVGRQLGVEAVLTGGIVRRAGRLAISADLTDVASGRSLWRGAYERDAADLLQLEDEIARAVADEGLRLSLSREDRRRLARNATNDPVAYELYWQAVHLNERENEADYLRARALLDRTIARDVQFADAYIAQAATYAVMAVDGLERPTESWPLSNRNVRRALDLDSGMPDAHASAASFEFFFNWNWEAAEEEWTLALRAGAANVHPDLLSARALQRWALGHGDEALRLIRQARQADPLTPMFMVREADYLAQLDQHDAAAALYERAIHADDADSRGYYGLAALRRTEGRFDDAVDAMRRAEAVAGEDAIATMSPAPRGSSGCERIARLIGRRELDALELRHRAGRYVSPLDFARAYAQLGHAERAFEHFEPAFADRAPGLVFLDVDRAWEAVRKDARFNAARRRVGLV